MGVEPMVGSRPFDKAICIALSGRSSTSVGNHLVIRGFMVIKQATLTAALVSTQDQKAILTLSKV